MKSTKSTIPPKLREELKQDPEYGFCFLTGEQGTREDPIEWHHNLKFAGKNVQRRFAIIPILRSIHHKADTRETRERLDWIMWNRATPEEIAEFSKAESKAQKKAYLNSKFGIWKMPLKKPATEAKSGSSKKHWYPVTDEEWTLVLQAVHHYKENEGVFYSPHQIISQWIKEGHERIVEAQKEFGDNNPKVGTVF